MAVKKLGHQPVNQQVYAQILELINARVLAPGSRLDEQSLAAEMGVSRTPLREAIGRLAEKGVVEYRPYQGNFIRTFTTREVRDIYDVRRALEELAIRLTAARMTDEKLATIRAILDDIEAAMARGDVETVNAADRRFHDAITQFSENETLMAAIEDLSHQVQIIRMMANQNPDVVSRTAMQRADILAALEARDADEAANLIGRHIGFVGASVIEALEAAEALERASGGGAGSGGDL